MDGRQSRAGRVVAISLGVLAAWGLGSCGGGSTGTAQDSGANKTYLSVAASDPDGDTLHYQWRVTAGSIENRDSRETVWTMPDGPGLHFAYVTVSDGRGGYAEQQYAVSTDAIATPTAPRPAVTRAAPGNSSDARSAGRLRFTSADNLAFAVAGAASQPRDVYLPDVLVQLSLGSTVVFSGSTDASGELSLPNLEPGAYTLKCTSVADGPLADCGAINMPTPPATPPSSPVTANVRPLSPVLTPARNLRLFGHVTLADGSVCGVQNEFFALQSAATVQLLQSDGSATAPPVRVNRFGDYAIDAAVLAHGQYVLRVACEGYTATLPVPSSTNPLGYVSGTPVELTHQIVNNRPSIAKVVANGPDGNVRGAMVVPEDGTSTALPGWRQFLAYKGHDTRLSACEYYRSIGAVGGCDSQGNLQDPISLDDWKRQHAFKPYDNGNAEVSAVYINRMDLNLVRRMSATKTGPDNIAFVVCNHPGPEGSSQREVDAVMDIGLADQKMVACVAMEWSTSPGVNYGRPFTKFLTFGPDGRLLPSINLDGRGEKYMPGACVACHSGTQYNGRFTEHGSPSPYLGAGFLPFDTGNYLFGSRPGMSEAEQTQAIRDLNMLVRATDRDASNQSITKLIDGWYTSNPTTLDRQYVPDAWQKAELGQIPGQPAQPGVGKLYREVVGGVCRTCHAAMGSDVKRFDWDTNVFSVINNPTAHAHFCGGTSDVAINASMPNALISRDRLADRIQADPELATLMQKYLGCVSPLPDPAYAKR